MHALTISTVGILNLFRNKLVRFSLLQAGILLVFLLVGFRGWPLVLSVSAVAGVCSSLSRRDEWWWSIVHVVFPVAVYASLKLQIHPAYFLFGFLLLAGFNWRTAQNRVPYFPSGPVTWKVVEQALPSRPIRFVDIGSGLGGLGLHLAKRRRDSRFFGIEISPLPWLVSRLRAVLRSNCEFDLGDYGRLDLQDYDVVFAYLSPAVMPEIWSKAKREMRAGSILMSFEFEVPGAAPSAVLPAGRGGRPLHVWVMESAQSV